MRSNAKKLFQKEKACFCFCSDPIEENTRATRKSLGKETFLDEAFFLSHPVKKHVICVRSEEEMERFSYILSSLKNVHATLLFKDILLEICDGKKERRSCLPKISCKNPSSIGDAVDIFQKALKGEKSAHLSNALALADISGAPEPASSKEAHKKFETLLGTQKMYANYL